MTMKATIYLTLASLMTLAPLGAAAEETKAPDAPWVSAWNNYLAILAVHPDSDTIVQREDVQAVIAAGNGGVLSLPKELKLPYYRLMPMPRRNEEDDSALLDGQGKPIVDYLVVRDHDIAKKDGKFISWNYIESAEQSGRELWVTLTDTGAQRMQALTRKMKLGRNRLAITLNGYVLSAPIVHTVLGKNFTITGLTQKEVDIFLYYVGRAREKRMTND